MKSPIPEAWSGEGVFLMQSPICTVNFTNMSRSGWTWYNLWNLLTINFKNKYFHNSVDWSGLRLQVYIPSWLPKILRFIVFRLLENVFVKLPSHDLIINLSCRIDPPSKKRIFSHIPWKASRQRSLHSLWGKHCAFALYENYVGYILPQYLQESAD